MNRGYRPSLLAWLIGKSLYVCADGSCIQAPGDIQPDQPRPLPRAVTRTSVTLQGRAPLRG